MRVPCVGIEDFERVLAEIKALDPSDAGFRFHRKRDGSPSLNSPTTRLDLANFQRVMRDVHGFVECANMEVDHRLEIQAEMHSWFGP
jgi:hypothetical protein